MKLEDREYSFREMLAPAMKITEPKEATEYLEAMVQHNMERHGQSREEATHIQKSNLAFFAGYYDHETRLRVENMFGCIHPVFGAAVDGPMSPQKAFEMGALFGAGVE